MISNQGEILSVPVGLEDIKKSYGVMSRFYALTEGVFERGLRQRSLHLLSVTPSEVVLEIGVGTGYSLKEIAGFVGEKGKAHGLDVTPHMLELTRRRLEKAGYMSRVELYEGDAREMPYQNGRFDAIYMASTLELFDTPDIPVVLNEVRRVLKPSGRLGVASLTKEGKERSRFVRFYEWLHQKVPKYINCRPIYVGRVLEEAGYEITRTEEFTLLGMVPWRIAVAKPSAS